jgi:hypothetical protein
MTVISENVHSIAGVDNTTVLTFRSPSVRDSDDDTALITPWMIQLTAVGGVLTTPDLEPGPAIVGIGISEYAIQIPESATPIRLWPLIEAALPVSPAEQAHAVIDAGGVRRIQLITESAYLALTTPDPETLYVVLEG